MPLYRGYDQPDNPVIHRSFDVEAPSQDVEYSKQLKAACVRGAGPKPDPPNTCPRCGEVASFVSRVCFKYGIAGAWNMKCGSCAKVHIPEQQGPSEKTLQQIEAIRAHDVEEHLARKQYREDKRVEKKAVKEKKESERLERRAAKEKQTHGSTNDSVNAKKMQAGRGSGKKAASPDRNAMGMDEPHRPFGVVGNVSIAVHLSQGPHEYHQDTNVKFDEAGSVFDPEVRTIVIVVWEKAGQQPFIDRVPVPLHEKLYLYHNARVRAIPPPTEFERWVFTGNVWSEVPWDITPLEVRPEDEVVFVRVSGITCLGFGQQLHDYQGARGHALPHELSLARTIYNPPSRYRWILVWTEDLKAPRVFLFDFALLDEPRNGMPLPMPWLDLLHDAPFFLVWHEVDSRWAGVHHNATPKIPPAAPILLLAHPGVEVRLGSGEAIAWLETWRASHPLAQREPTPPFHWHARSSGTREGPGALPATSVHPKKRAREASVPPVSAHEDTGGGSRENPLTVSDDEPEFVQGSSQSPMKARRCTRADGSKRAKVQEFDSKGELIIDLTDD